jgi:hypothetical protein
MTKKFSKATKHNVKSMGTIDLGFEVFCKDKVRRGVPRERVVQECLFKDDGIVACSFQKPMLLQLPCSHVIATCAESAVLYGPFMSEFFKKDAITSAWAREVYGVAMFRPFT